MTWDVDSRDGVAVSRVRRFVFGDRTRHGDKLYVYAGFVEKEGVRYLGQSVVFVTSARLRELDAFLTVSGIDHEVTPATLG